MIALLNPKLWGALIAAALLAFVLAFTYRAGKANVRADFDKYKLEQAAQTVKAEVAARAEETRRESEKQKVIDDARIQTAAAQSAALDADAAALGLRKRVAALIASRAAPAIPVLPAEARVSQVPTPSTCSQGCSFGLTQFRASLLPMPIDYALPAAHAKLPTAR